MARRRTEPAQCKANAAAGRHKVGAFSRRSGGELAHPLQPAAGVCGPSAARLGRPQAVAFRPAERAASGGEALEALGAPRPLLGVTQKVAVLQGAAPAAARAALSAPAPSRGLAAYQAAGKRRIERMVGDGFVPPPRGSASGILVDGTREPLRNITNTGLGAGAAAKEPPQPLAEPRQEPEEERPQRHPPPPAQPQPQLQPPSEASGSPPAPVGTGSSGKSVLDLEACLPRPSVAPPRSQDIVPVPAGQHNGRFLGFAAVPAGPRTGGLSCGPRRKDARRSYVSQVMDSRRQFRGVPEEDIDAVLGEYADELLRDCHEESQRHLPVVPHLRSTFDEGQRRTVVNWFIQACAEMRFSDPVLFSSVLLLDRYCALLGDCPMGGTLVLMAVISTALKTQAVQDEVCAVHSFREQLSQLCHYQFPVEEILAMEVQVLRVVRYNVTVPTVLDFFDTLSAPLLTPGEPADSYKPRCLASFLVQLSIFDVDLHYGRYPHAILAASALVLALSAYKATSFVYQALLEDLAIACTDVPDVAGLLMNCSLDLLKLWQEAVVTQFVSYRGLFTKFHGAVALYELMSPPSVGDLPPLTALPRAECVGFDLEAKSSPPCTRWCEACRCLAPEPEGLEAGSRCPRCLGALAEGPGRTEALSPVAALRRH